MGSKTVFFFAQPRLCGEGNPIFQCKANNATVLRGLALASAEQEHGSSIVETKNVNAKNIMILISDLETPEVRL